ncbi:MAG: hypothetical protein A2015_14565 [Spirochaetes bacterium GWF1_31_7]|nr:MAG: hypothetical protein A2Y30_03190 [Spirochaetes bacterium GWE1_32_154]OHD47863.1 MAG: hypothetical protein A2Y29_17705 [Spirochaetes bacterium GWE2_31_10]OHD50620.1 MAG: hypothetical protein A2015_14565 [Spirochaetes bacterium GWF1_31_7]HBD92714.1 two-component system response regulator [Spirochaetia bacterium]HBI36497.1 two-component system response regulator [Spirochaetia bacterium]
MDTIAIVEDETDISDLIALHLKRNSFAVFQFYNAKTFTESLKNSIPDLVILDLMLPDLDGMDVCKYLKSVAEYKNIPVIILTAKQDETDKVVGLEIGADDYVTKPFSPRELVARVKAVLRRVAVPESSSEGANKIINIADELFIDPDKYSVRNKENKEIQLTTTEFKILTILAGNEGWVYSRDKLIAGIWGEDRYVIDRTIDVHIKHLREKIGDAARFIKNVRGVGYKLDTKE